jgi:aspartyl-tRNA(Asn)/glutamyl-tRNA(Gln) amidotransferase subunit A
MSAIKDLDGAALTAGFRDGGLSPVEVLRDVLARLDAAEPAVNAFMLVDREGAHAAAQASEARWRAGRPLSPADGLLFTIKDNIAFAGFPSRRGSRTSSEAPATENAPIVDRLIEAGCVPLGKTTLPEFGWKGLGDSPLSGVTRNPWDVATTTGGSSAGAAAAAALNLGTFHIGTDGAGSIRIPAAFCGIYGIKPSWGRVPASPPSPFAPVAHLGPMTRRVADAALMLRLIAGPDPRDITAMTEPPPDYASGLEDGVRGLRVAWSPRLGYVPHVDPEVAALTERAARAFGDLGAEVEEADPGFEDPIALLDVIWQVGAWCATRPVPEADRARMEPPLLAEAMAGSRIAAPDYVAALAARSALFARMARFHERYDLLLTPALATPAFAVSHLVPPGGAFGPHWTRWTPFTYPFNLTLQPAATVPCGLTKGGLPVGLQIVGPMNRDALVLRASRAFEAAHPFATLDAPRGTA